MDSHSHSADGNHDSHNSGGLPAPSSRTDREGDIHMSITTEKPTSATVVRSYRVEFSEEAIVDLRRRIEATRWPEKETVEDPSQGVQLKTMQELARYWGNGYDFGRVEARLNALPQFVTEID